LETKLAQFTLLRALLALLAILMGTLSSHYLTLLLGYLYGDQALTIKSEQKINKAVLFSDAGAANFACKFATKDNYTA
jgi:predicted permease